ncbi:hypothetical protein [Clostridium sp.]|jgi:hypothetical protein|uniref:hypothetical protein n=1 Tax=Clostridium sp. TaxID=1506 RepID=UPI003A163443
MKRKIEEMLIDYKYCTIEIIEILKKDEFHRLENIMEKRQCILEELISDSSKKDEIKALYKKLNIENIENEARSVMKKKSIIIKRKLECIAKNKSAANAYGNKIRSAKIFSKKI